MNQAAASGLCVPMPQLGFPLGKKGLLFLRFPLARGRFILYNDVRFGEEAKAEALFSYMKKRALGSFLDGNAESSGDPPGGKNT
ncbi:MAG: hypothetical protein IK099_05570 [Clostridia bacterium]|nr:hypothetical protein [Clostridia bacterium]